VQGEVQDVVAATQVEPGDADEAERGGAAEGEVVDERVVRIGGVAVADQRGIRRRGGEDAGAAALAGERDGLAGIGVGGGAGPAERAVGREKHVVIAFPALARARRAPDDTAVSGHAGRAAGVLPSAARNVAGQSTPCAASIL